MGDHISGHDGNLESPVADLEASDCASVFSLSTFSASSLFEASNVSENNDCANFLMEKEQQQKEDEEGGNSSSLEDASSTLIIGLASADDMKLKSLKLLSSSPSSPATINEKDDLNGAANNKRKCARLEAENDLDDDDGDETSDNDNKINSTAAKRVKCGSRFRVDFVVPDIFGTNRKQWFFGTAKKVRKVLVDRLATPIEWACEVTIRYDDSSTSTEKFPSKGVELLLPCTGRTKVFAATNAK